MNVISMPIVGVASISFYVGLYHLFIFVRRRQLPEHLTFALMFFINVFYDIFCIGLYQSTSLTESEKWERLLNWKGLFTSQSRFRPDWHRNE